MSDLIREARRNAKNWADKPESAAMWNRFVDELERLTDRINVLEEKNSYLKTWGHNQYGFLKERIEVLEVEINRLKDGVFRIEELVDSVANPAIAAADKEVSDE